MPEIPGNLGVPNVAPDVESPDDYQQVDATAGKAMAQAGQSAVDLSKVFGQIQTDAAVNNALDQAHSIMDHYLSLNGQDALDAQASTQQALAKVFSNGGAGLGSLDQIAQYNETTRNYQERLFAGQIASHATEAQKQVGVAANDGILTNAINTVTSNPNDEDTFDASIGDATRAAVQGVMLEGNENVPGVLMGAVTQARAQVIAARAGAMGINNPSAGLAFVQKYQDELGDKFAPLASSLQRSARLYALPGVTDGAVASVLGGGGSADNIVDAIHQQESGGASSSPTSVDGAVGGFQIKPSTFQAFAEPGQDINNPNDNAAVGTKIIQHYEQQYPNDPARVAVAYFSGPANVAPPGSPTPWIHDYKDGNGESTSAYVGSVTARLGLAGGATPGQAPSLDQLGANLPYYQQQAADRAAAQFPNDPELAAQAAKMASDQVTKIYGDQVKARDDAIAANFNTVMNAVQQNHIESTADLIKAVGPAAAAYAGLPLDKQQSLEAMMAKNVPGAQTVWTPQAQQTNDALLGLAYTDPSAFIKIDLTSPAMINTLPRDMIQTLSAKQAEIAKGIYQGVTPDQMNGALSFVAPMLSSAGIPTTDRGDPAGTSYKSNPQYQQFAGVFGRDIQAYFAKNGRMPDAADMQAMASRLLIQGTMAGTGGIFFGPKTERLYQAEAPGGDLSKFQPDIPAPALQSINDAYERQYGHPPDLETAGQIYLQNEGAQ